MDEIDYSQWLLDEKEAMDKIYKVIDELKDKYPNSLVYFTSEGLDSQFVIEKLKS